MADSSPLFRVRTVHSGADFESGAAHRARGVNEPQPGVEAVDARLDEDSWSGGHSNYEDRDGRRRKLASTPDSKMIPVPGRSNVKVFKGSSAVEDERWIYITELKENKSKVYLCLACRPFYSFTGSEARVISHKLQLGDGTVKNCSVAPSAACRIVLERVKAEKDRKSALGGKLGCASAVKDPVVASSSNASSSSFFGGGVAAVAEADAALACWAVAHDVPWRCIDSRDMLWVDFLQKMKKAGPSWSVPKREILSCDEPRGEESRPGGLYLALKDKDKDKERILTAAAKEGGTLVSDGAKLSSRKRGMLNTALVTHKGELLAAQPSPHPPLSSQPNSSLAQVLSSCSRLMARASRRMASSCAMIIWQRSRRRAPCEMSRRCSRAALSSPRRSRISSR